MTKISIFTDSAFAIFSANNILKGSEQKADLLTISEFWVTNLADNAYLNPILIEKWPRGFQRYLPINTKRSTSQQNILNYLQKTQPDEIWFHEIYSDQWNWIALIYKQLFPSRKIRLLPESFLNAISHPITSTQYRNQKIKASLAKSYSPFKGEWIGLDAQFNHSSLVENILLPQYFPHPYKEDKVQYFNYNITQDTIKPERAILVEQALLDRGFATESQLKDMYAKLTEDWEKHHIKDISIAPHPRAKKRDFAFTNLPLFERQSPFLEEDIAQYGFGHIYSSYSMIFLSSIHLQGRFVSFGLGGFENFPEQNSYKRILSKMPVEFI
ncbi:MAG: hypothetical protein ACK5MJ_01050 [Alphaproteobacteria bacterium]